MMAKLAFQQLLLQSSVSHDPLEIFLICWLAAHKNKKYIYYHTNIIIINVENVEDAFFDSSVLQSSIYLKLKSYEIWQCQSFFNINLLRPCYLSIYIIYQTLLIFHDWSVAEWIHFVKLDDQNI